MWNGPLLDPHEYPTHLPEEVTFHRIEAIGTNHLAVYYNTNHLPYKPWVIVCHGMMQNSENSLLWFTHLQGKCNVLMWDYRGHGRSTGRADEQVVLYDLHTVLQWLLATHPDVDCAKDCILLGSSLGTFVVLSYLEYYWGKHQAVPISVILCYPFLNLRHVFKQFGFPPWLAGVVGSMDVSKQLKHLVKETPARLLVIGSRFDNMTPWEPVLKLCPQAINVDGDHCGYPTTLWNKIEEFLMSS